MFKCSSRIGETFQQSNKTTLESIDKINRIHQIGYRKRQDFTKIKGIEISYNYGLRLCK